jgi:phosphoribosylformylglycinamidine cyclo-ligase
VPPTPWRRSASTSAPTRSRIFRSMRWCALQTWAPSRSVLRASTATIPSRSQRITYRDAGVDTAEGARAVERIRESVRSTYRPEVIGDIGGFGGLFSAAARRRWTTRCSCRAPTGSAPSSSSRSYSASTTRRHRPRRDVRERHPRLGAEPLFFLDYVAIGKLDSELSARDRLRDRRGLPTGRLRARGRRDGRAPRHAMEPDDYDLSGFCVGVVDRAEMIDGSDVPGRRRARLASSGLHSQRLLARAQGCRRGA